MALSVLIHGQQNSLPVLEDAGFTKVNAGANATVGVNTPLGVLGGTVASYSADYTVGAADEASNIAGLFLNNAAGAAFENSPAVASGKVTVLKGNASVEVDVYADDVTGLAVGADLYSDADGFLTGVAGSGAIIAVVTKVPSVSSPTLGLDMRI
jgi:hypothetical protein